MLAQNTLTTVAGPANLKGVSNDVGVACATDRASIKACVSNGRGLWGRKLWGKYLSVVTQTNLKTALKEQQQQHLDWCSLIK